MLDEILADIPKEGDDFFKNEETDTPSESQPEKELDKEEPVEPKEEDSEAKEGEPKSEDEDNTPEEDTPYHKRWEKREQKLRDELTDQFSKEIEELKSFKNEVAEKLPNDTTVPDWFVELYGDNPVAYQKYSQARSQEEAEMEKRILERQQEAVRQQTEATDKWNKWVDEEVSRLQADGKKFTKNELLKVMVEFRPTDEKGNFNFDKGYEILETKKALDKDPAKSETRKKIADSTLNSNPKESKKTTMTPEEIRKISWSSL